MIPYLRVKEFKIISLKMIVASMLQHQAKVEPVGKFAFKESSPSFPDQIPKKKKHAEREAAREEKMAASARKSMEASKAVGVSAATSAADSRSGSPADISEAAPTSDSAADPTATAAADTPNREEQPGRGDGGSEGGGGGDSASGNGASGSGGGPSLEGPKPEPMSTPKPPSRNSSEGKKAAKGFSLETLGSDLYLPGEVRL